MWGAKRRPPTATPPNGSDAMKGEKRFGTMQSGCWHSMLNEHKFWTPTFWLRELFSGVNFLTNSQRQYFRISTHYVLFNIFRALPNMDKLLFRQCHIMCARSCAWLCRGAHGIAMIFEYNSKDNDSSNLLVYICVSVALNICMCILNVRNCSCKHSPCQPVRSEGKNGFYDTSAAGMCGRVFCVRACTRKQRKLFLINTRYQRTGCFIVATLRPYLYPGNYMLNNHRYLLHIVWHDGAKSVLFPVSPSSAMLGSIPLSLGLSALCPSSHNIQS